MAVGIKYVCPHCGKDNFDVVIETIAGKRVPTMWICLNKPDCYWRGTARKMIHVEIDAPVSVVSNIPNEIIGSVEKAIVEQEKSEEYIEPQTTPQPTVREQGESVCPECREVILYLIQTNNGYSCPECESMLFTIDQIGEAVLFLGKSDLYNSVFGGYTNADMENIGPWMSAFETILLRTIISGNSTSLDVFLQAFADQIKEEYQKMGGYMGDDNNV